METSLQRGDCQVIGQCAVKSGSKSLCVLGLFRGTVLRSTPKSGEVSSFMPVLSLNGSAEERREKRSVFPVCSDDLMVNHASEMRDHSLVSGLCF